MASKGNVEAALEFAKANTPATIETVEFGSGQALVGLANGAVLDIKPILDRWRLAPEREEGTASLLTEESLIAYIRAALCADGEGPVDDGSASALFARWDPPMIEAVLDHWGTDGAPGWRRSRAQYVLPLSDEWKAWTNRSGVELDQKGLALFLEDHLEDVRPAPMTAAGKAFAELHHLRFAAPTDLLGLARGLTLRVARDVANVINIDSGESEIVFKEAHSDRNGAALAVPRAFLIVVPIYEGGAAYEIPVRLRYRVDGSAVKWTLTMVRPERALRDAVTESARRVGEKTGLACFLGSDAGARR
jgi:uncharacterized protein YfdQ (DUF2303 family)